MKKPAIKMQIIKEVSGFRFQAHSRKRSIFTQAENLDELKFTILDAVTLTFENQGFI